VKTIQIKAPGERGQADVRTADGQPVLGVTECDISLRPGELATARLEIMVGAVDVEAHPLLGLETLTEAAAAHGYRLVPIGETE
jgi:hypothetical protein